MRGGCSSGRRLCAALCALTLMLIGAANAAADPAFSAHGSVGQVYVTGLAPSQQMTLLNGSGRTVATQQADSLGGLIFRNVAPGSGYRVRPAAGGTASGPLTVLSDAAGAAEHERLQPVDPVARLRLPDHARRHQAVDLRPPAAGRGERAAGGGASCRRVGNGPYPDADRVLGLRLRRPGRPAERHRHPRQPDGLHRRRREHARHRLLGRGVRLLRAAPEPGRLRRGRDDRAAAVGAAPQGRHDGHLLRRHQPALHGAGEPAEPGRDLAAVGDRQHADHALPGRDPEHGLRGGLGAGARPRRDAGVADRRAGLGLPAHPAGRPDLQGQPGPARRGGRPDGEDPRQRPLRAGGRRPAVADHVREQDQGADVHGLPVDRRADGRPLPRPRRALHRHEPQVVHVHERHARRLARPGDVRPLVRLPRAVRGAAGADPELGGDPRGGRP